MDVRASAPTAPATPRTPSAPWVVVFVSLAVVSLLAFLVAPWPLQAKSLAALHGLCAQRPSHSFWFGDRRLPFGARMTGIYAGFLITQLTLLARGRFRAARLPSLPLLAALALFVVAMGIDGINSTLVDLHLAPFYVPSNDLRYLTGALTGTTVGTCLWFLAGAVLWQPSQGSRRTVLLWRDLLLLAAPAGVFGLAATSGWLPLYPLLAVVLVVAAVVLLWEFALITLQLFRMRERTAQGLSDLAGPAVAALLLSYAVLLVLGGGRFALEAAFHLHTLR